ncbi:MAG: DUF4493 domain-containing protein [Muribaculaceae bacterium]|nr:DUF4493 domain-containing protein [Muribaculaceae bacterium]
MKKIKYIIPIMSLFGLASCSVEAPFEGAKNEAIGELSKYAIDLDASLINTRAESNNIINDFNIQIKSTDSETKTVFSGTYKEMPEVITLQAGKYKAYASYGTEVMAAFESPFYLGESDEFQIEANKITTNIGTILCKLENVKVSINFHSSIYQNMGDDAYVLVSLNKDSEHSLKFTKNEQRAGYFKHTAENTLVATFHGTIDGVEITETKTLDGVDKGNHYSLTFAKHTYSGDSDEGSIIPSVSVSAAVTIVNQNENITIEEDKLLDDNERPSEGNSSSGENPGTQEPENPGTQEPEGQGKIPSIEAQAPIDLDKVNEVNESSTVVIVFTSQTGFTKFEADIESNDLTDSELRQVGLASHLDLINPGELKDPLQGLGLLQNEQGEDVDSVLGQKIVKFDISKFMTPLSLFPGEHHFIIKVGDDNGSNQCTLKLKI